jgi:hypothetical protein
MRLIYAATLSMHLAMAPAVAADITLKRAMLLTGGIGYFDHKAEVIDDAELVLDVPPNQVDDVLKSIVVFDSKGIGYPRLAGRDPLSRLFSGLPFDPDAFGSPAAAAIKVSASPPIVGRLLPVVPAIQQGWSVAETGADTLEHQQLQTREMEDAVATELNRLTFDPSDSRPNRYNVRDNDATALVNIASMDDRARLYGLYRAINDSSWRAKLLRQPEAMINAMVGTSIQRRNLASSLVVSAAAAQTESRRYPSDVSEAIARVANALDAAATVPLSWWLAAIDANKTSPDTRRLGTRLGAAGRQAHGGSGRRGDPRLPHCDRRPQDFL